MDRYASAAFEPDGADEPITITTAPERVTLLHAGNRSPGVESRLMFPGWGPKLWERPDTLRPEPRAQRYGE